MDNIYKEMQKYVRENFSVTSKKYDMEFKNKSIESIVKIRKDLMHKLNIQRMKDHIKKKSVIGNKIHKASENYLKDTLLQKNQSNQNNNLNLLLSKDKTVYKSFNTCENIIKKKKINIDDEISDIFKTRVLKENCRKNNEEIKNNSLPHSLTQKLNIRNKSKYISKNQQYFPNYNSIYPHSPIAKITPIIPEKNKPIIYKKVCNKFIKDNNYHSRISRNDNNRRSMEFINNNFKNNLFYSLIENQKIIPEGVIGDEKSKLDFPKQQVQCVDNMHTFYINKKLVSNYSRTNRKFNKNNLVFSNLNQPLFSTLNIKDNNKRSKMVLSPLISKNYNVDIKTFITNTEV